MFLGAGGASLGIAKLLVKAMEAEGLDEKEAQNRIYLMDIDGLITHGRQNINNEQQAFAKKMETTKNLLHAVNEIKPTMLIGMLK